MTIRPYGLEEAAYSPQAFALDGFFPLRKHGLVAHENKLGARHERASARRTIDMIGWF